MRRLHRWWTHAGLWLGRVIGWVCLIAGTLDAIQQGR